VAAILGFAVINQSYGDNARYVSIALFGGFAGLGTWAGGRNWRQRQLLAVGIVAGLASTLGLIGVVKYDSKTSSIHLLQRDDQRIAALLEADHIQYLVGYYWRVIPIKEVTSQAHQAVVPLSNCSDPQQVLSSSAWQPQLLTRSFAYLLTSESTIMPAQNCRLQQITFLYGPPSSTVLLHGTAMRPTEELLLYDHGANIFRGVIRQCRQGQCRGLPQ
jgi:hypothetical protein